MLLNDCFMAPGGMVTLDQALAFLADRVEPVVGSEVLALPDCADRVLAEAVAAERDQPPFANSAMDGFAYRHADAPAGGELALVARVAAGHPLTEPPPEGTAVRIFTGAPMPPGLDTIAIQEDCQTFARDGREWVRIPLGLARGNYVRDAGEDFRAGATLLGPGRRLRPQDLAIAATAGRPELRVHRRLRVGVFSTGDELVEPGKALPYGSIYDGNRYALAALAGGLGCAVTDLGNLPDDLAVTAAALLEASRSFDLLLTAGGVSVGGEDHVRAAVETNGAINLWRIKIKPGKPTALGHIGDCAFVGLPGNPVSAEVMFMIFARPVILRLAGAVAERPSPVRYRIPAGFAFDKDHERREFLRARLDAAEDGSPLVRLHRGQGSHIISSLVESDGLVDLAEGPRFIQRGEPVEFIPYSALS